MTTFIITYALLSLLILAGIGLIAYGLLRKPTDEDESEEESPSSQLLEEPEEGSYFDLEVGDRVSSAPGDDIRGMEKSESQEDSVSDEKASGPPRHSVSAYFDHLKKLFRAIKEGRLPFGLGLRRNPREGDLDAAGDSQRGAMFGDNVEWSLREITAAARACKNKSRSDAEEMEFGSFSTRQGGRRPNKSRSQGEDLTALDWWVSDHLEKPDKEG